MRARNLKPGLFRNEVLAMCGGDTWKPWARLLFAGLPLLADREGRLEDRPRRIAADLFPYDDEVDHGIVGQLLDNLMSDGFIQRYMVDGEPFIQIVNFLKHQNPHKKEVPSVIPPNPNHSIIVDSEPSNFPVEDGPKPEPARLIPSSLIPHSLIPPPPETRSRSGSIAKTMAEDAEVDRRFARYRLDPDADDEDQAQLARVLTFVTTDHGTGKPLPTHKRVKILDEFVKYPPPVVFIACGTFEADGHLEAGKSKDFLLGICEKSAGIKYREWLNERGKEERHEVRTKQGPGRGPETAGLATTHAKA